MRRLALGTACALASVAAGAIGIVFLNPVVGRAQVREEGTNAPLRLAMSGAFQPFSTTDEDGSLVGLDADIGMEVARRLNRPAELVQTDWAGIQAGLQRRKYDLICGSMAITEPRLETMHFSLPYYVSGAQVFARRGQRDLRGKRIGVTEDSTYATYIAEHPELFPQATVLRYGSEAEIVTALGTDKIDAFVSDRIVGGFYASRAELGGRDDEIVAVGPLLYREACGIAARLDSGELIRAVNLALLGMVQDGTYSRIYEHWVGAEPDIALLLSSWAEHGQHFPSAEDVEPAATDARFAERALSMLPLLAEGALLTLELALITAFLALLAGALVGVGTVSRWASLRLLANGFVWFIRGTPLLVQLFIAYFAIATAINRIVGFELVGAFGAALIALIINTTAYNAETLRGGINAVDRGQWDAGLSLGMGRGLLIRRIILPQALRSSLPSLGNNLVVLVKDTSLVGAITLVELTYSARNVVFQSGQALLPFALAAVFYLAIISLVSIGISAWERHLGRARPSGAEANP